MEETVSDEVKDKAGFIFEHENSFWVFLYIKLNQDQLKMALPISYKYNINKCYLSCVIDSKCRDYLAQQSQTEIETFLGEHRVININHDYEKIKSMFPNITYELVNSYKKFVDKQLNGKEMKDFLSSTGTVEISLKEIIFNILKIYLFKTPGGLVILFYMCKHLFNRKNLINCFFKNHNQT